LSQTTASSRSTHQTQPVGPHYKWIALSNTTLGMLMATINSNIVLISLPAIFNGIGVNPLATTETTYLLWTLLGYMLVTATLVVTLGRISDMFGRVRLYNLGFAVFTVASILLFLTPSQGDAGAIEIIIFRLIQAVGGGLLFANSTAILTDAFPEKQRGMAMGINSMAAILGSIIGLILGGVLSAINWRLIFLVSVPFGIFGTVWAYMKLRDITPRGAKQKIDWTGNLTFFFGLTIALIGLVYGIEPYGNSPVGFGNPFVLGCLAVGILLLVIFVFAEMRVKAPMFNLQLFHIRMFTAGNIASLLAGLARAGLQFILIIWLQGIWLPLHGYSFEETPLWAGIYMLPLMIGFIVVGPLSGILSDRLGPRLFAVLGMIIQAVCFVLLTLLPTNFNYVWFAVLLIIMGIGQGLFTTPNTTAIMNSVPAHQRGVASGMRATFMNVASVLSMTMFFSIVTLGLAAGLPAALTAGLTQVGVPSAFIKVIANLPPIAALFAAFLGYNPMKTLLPQQALNTMTPANQATVLGKTFFPTLISSPFMTGLHIAFYIAAALCVIAALASLVRPATLDEIEKIEIEIEGQPASEEEQLGITGD
jgi:EmrB/QacA subfamily drug resistance transporter